MWRDQIRNRTLPKRPYIGHHWTSTLKYTQVPSVRNCPHRLFTFFQVIVPRDRRGQIYRIKTLNPLDRIVIRQGPWLDRPTSAAAPG